LRDDAKLSVTVDDSRLSLCDPSKRRMFRVFVPALEGCWLPAVHSDCQCNEWAALRLRTLGPTPPEPLRARAQAEFFRTPKNLARHANLERWTLERTVDSYSGSLRRRYQEALESLGVDELGDDDAKLSAFLKGEKFNPNVKVAKPRLINPRTARFNLVLASFLKPLEHMLWRRWKAGHGCPRSRVSAKGLNHRQRAELISRKMEDVGDCVVFEVDGKAFEAHVTEQQLRLEHSVYKAAFPKDPVLNWLLEKQLVLKGKTNHGLRYSRPGCRASGDYNTGLGNTLLMGVFVIAALERANCAKRWSVLADGDNCLIFVDRLSAGEVYAGFSRSMSSVCSHEVTLEKPCMSIEEITFGQCQPVRTGKGLKMVRNVWKTISGAFCGYRHFHEPQITPRLVRAIAQAEGSLVAGIPLLQPYFAAVIEVTKGYKELTQSQNQHLLEARLLGVPGYRQETITDACRHSFEVAYGYSPEEQKVIEAFLVSVVKTELPRVLAGATWLTQTVDVQCGPLGDRDGQGLDGLGELGV